MRGFLLLVALFGVTMLGFGAVRLLTPGRVEWTPPFAFGAALVALAIWRWKPAFGRHAFALRRADLTRSGFDRLWLGIAGGYVVVAAGALALGEGSSADGRTTTHVPFPLVLAVLAIGLVVLGEAARKPNENDGRKRESASPLEREGASDGSEDA